MDAWLETVSENAATIDYGMTQNGATIVMRSRSNVLAKSDEDVEENGRYFCRSNPCSAVKKFTRRKDGSFRLAGRDGPRLLIGARSPWYPGKLG